MMSQNTECATAHILLILHRTCWWCNTFDEIWSGVIQFITHKVDAVTEFQLDCRPHFQVWTLHILIQQRQIMATDGIQLGLKG